MPNEYVNEVIFGNETIMSIKNDTVTPQTLLSGATAHDRSGAPITGTATQGHTVQNSSGTDMTQRSNMKFVNCTVTDDSENDTTIVSMSGAVVDNALSTTSTNPVENRVITNELDKAYKTDDSSETDIADDDSIPFYDASASEKKKSLWSNIIAKIKAALATVATSGSYNDLSDQPTIPSVVNNLTSDSTTNALSAAQGKALANGSARDSTKLPLAGGTLTGHLYVTKASEDAVIGAGNSNNNGKIWLYNSGYHHGLVPTTLTAHRTVTLPNSSGTVAYVENTVPKSGGAFTGKVTSNSNIETSERLLAGDTIQAAYAVYAGAINASIAGTTYSNKAGVVRVCDDSGHYVSIVSSSLSSNRTLTLPNGSGTLARVELTVPSTGGTFTGSITVDKEDGTASSVGSSSILLGNNIASGIAKNSYGQVVIFSQSNAGIRLRAQDLTSSRNLYLPATGTALATSASSSARVKENIRDMTEEEAIKILDIPVVKFDYKEEYEPNLLDQSGVIAEEVIDIIPEVVNIHPMYDETKAIDPASNPSPTVDYGKFAPYLIKMIQIQQEKIEALEQRIAVLENN